VHKNLQVEKHAACGGRGWNQISGETMNARSADPFKRLDHTIPEVHTTSEINANPALPHEPRKAAGY
jgi:hypothetical protein